MKRFTNVTLWLGFVLSAALVVAQPAAAQTSTTGSLAGTVEDQQGGRLPGVTVQAVHTATGTSYVSVTATDGRFVILNVRVGDYTVKAGLSGFKDLTKSIVVTLGEESALTFTLELAAVSETVIVTAVSPLVDVTTAGTGGSISNLVKESLPTISRSLNDVVRSNPYFNMAALNDETPAPAVAGRNFRYNNIQIDGAVNNDLFGLAASGGTPGGATDTAPISLDAIQELQLVVSPYDVRQGLFSGGGINAVTKSGTNQLNGTAFYFGRNQNWVGKGVTGQKVGKFSDKQGGFAAGGPIKHNRAFFFGTADWGRKTTPSGFSINGSGVRFGNEAAVDEFLRILRERYNYDLGPTAKDEFSRTTNSDKIFVRGDFNLNARNQLTVRHNFVKARNDIAFPSVTTYHMPDNFYLFRSTTNSTVAQLNTTFANAVNEFRVTYSTIEDRRGGQDFEPRPFPFVSVTVAPGFTVRAGRENFSTANELDQDVLEIHNDYTMIRGSHTYTFGTHNEFFKFRNLFIRDNFGNYSFASLATFAAGLAQGFDHSFSATSDPQQAARFSVKQWGVYAGDQWRVRPNLTLTYGVRADTTQFPDKPTDNPVSQAAFNLSTTTVPSPIQWSPRIGFNYDLRGDGKDQIRGGLGLFTGRTPYVWLSNQYGNTGIEFTRLSRSFSTANNIPFVPDATAQPRTLTGGSFATNEIDLIDPDYNFPSVWRGNLAYDREFLGGGLVGTAEFLWSKNRDDIKYQNLNLVEVGTQIDGRPRYTRTRVPTLSDVIYLTNSSLGDTWNLTFEVKRPFKNGWFANGSWSYGRSRSIMDGTSSQAASNWGNVYVPGDPNNPPLTRSNFDPGHRVSLTAAYDVPFFKGIMMTASVFYSGQSGRPYNLSYNRDVNGDGRGFNDNFYLPANATELPLAGGTYEQLRAFLDLEECTRSQIGQIMERNTCRAPWTNTLDARLNFKLPYRRVRAEVTLDILNLINLIDPKSGLVQFANFNQITAFQPTVSTAGVITAVNIAAINAPTFTRFTRSDLRSRWQMQLGGRVRF